MDQYKSYLSETGLFWDEFRKGESLWRGFNETLKYGSYLNDKTKMLYLFDEYGNLAIKNRELFVKKFDCEKALKGLSDNLVRCFCIYFHTVGESISVTVDWDHLREYIESETNQEEKENLVPGFEFKKAFNPEETIELLRKKALKKLQERVDGLERILVLNENEIIEGLIRDCKQPEDPEKHSK